MRIPPEKLRVVHGGINLDGYEQSPLPFDPPVIGYLCRMSEYFGLGILFDAFIRLKQDERLEEVQLSLMGGYTGDDKRFIDEMRKKVAGLGYEQDVRIYDDFDKEHRIRFLKSLTLLSVPVPAGEAFGTYQVEALAAGVPIVQPNVGGYPEFVEATGGGIVYKPNDAETLAQAMTALLTDPDRTRELGADGRTAVLERYSMHTMASAMIDVYESIVNAESM